ncbi:MAG: HAD family hydrolase [Clostridia bacterium]|nr:HAD family hydrolase [Clostridia bacterium]
MSSLNTFVKRRDLLVCVDSDGCAMDTMNCKHIYSFGPCMVEEWGLGEWRAQILKRWNEINLYQVTRGINRFKGLAMALTEINEKYTRIPGIDTLNEWCATTHALSMPALREAIPTYSEGEGRECLSKALAWSQAVNESINRLPEELKVPFEGAKEGLEAAHAVCDVAIVSSANREAVVEEWEKFGLIPLADIMLTQDIGSKAYCIGEMLKFGYDKTRTLMVGDAMGDLDAARQNGVYYFPILPGREAESWQELVDEGLERLGNSTFGGEYQDKKIKEFMDNFK